MSATNLFGQYYNNLGKNKKYQGISYNCASATSGENTFQFKDGEAVLVDSNGEAITKIDLSKINSGPLTSYTTGSVVINPGEVKLIEGIEYGKLYKEIFFEVPNIYISSLEDAWPYLTNVKFTILLNVDLDLREYDVSTTVSTDNKVSIVDRIQKLINEIGAEGNIEVFVEAIEDEHGTTKTYLCFKSLVLGYDFIITEFMFFNHRIVKGDKNEYVEAPISSDVLDEIAEAEDNITFSDSTSFTSAYETSTGLVLDEDESMVGHYDNLDDPENPLSADHYYDGWPGFVGTVTEDNAYEFNGGDSDGNNPGEDVEDDDTTILPKMEILAYSDKSLDIPAFKYFNGAARVWVVVPEWPLNVEGGIYSLKLNHVRDHVTIFEPSLEAECKGLYEAREIDVYAGERNEVERHNLKEFKYWLGDNFAYMDSDNGTVTEVHHAKDTCDCPEIKLEIHNPHIGMYRYLDYVEMNDLWTSVGDFYGLVTNDDTDDVDIKNLANSIFLYNKNEFPVKVAYLICA
jgi:hypothetical protein